MTNFVIITNNPLVAEKYAASFSVTFMDEEYTRVLAAVRDMVHAGHRLLTHPLAGSIKPNETPFKSVFLTKQKGALDTQSLMIIENSIETCKKFKKLKFPNMSPELRADFSDIDCSLVDNAIVSAAVM